MAMKTILVRALGTDGCDLNRACLPVRYCGDELWTQHNIQVDLTTDILHTEKPDGVVAYRLLKDRAVVELARLRWLGTRVAWDTDDACDLIPRWSPVRYGGEDIINYHALHAVANERWCSTSNLANLTKAHRTLPNLIDPACFDLPKPPLGKRPVQVMWQGSCTHRGDLQLVEPAIRQILQDLPQGSVKFSFWGDAIPSLVKDCMGKGVQVLAPCGITEFYPRLAALQPDIMLCPLEDHPFNECKSNLKWMECAVAGACPIVSDCHAYSCVQDGETGLIAQREEWYQKLRWAIEDQAGRQIVAEQCKQCVREDWAWDGPLRSLWVNAFAGLLNA